MLASSFDFGSGVAPVVAIIAGVVTLWLQQRKAQAEADRSRTEAKTASEAAQLAAQQAAQEAREAAKELKPNGGSSIKDAIDRMEQRQIAHTQRSDARFNRIEKQMGLEPPMEVMSWPAPPPPPPPAV